MFHVIAKELTGFIYSFHMPAYVFVSGILFGKQLEDNKYQLFTDILKSKPKRVLVQLYMLLGIYPLKL